MLLPPVIAALWLLGGPYTEALPRLFDARGWKQAGGLQTSRCAMMLDLQAKIGLLGKSRDEIAALLGPADVNLHGDQISQWGLCPSFMDVWILEIHWGNGRVAKAVVRDT